MLQELNYNIYMKKIFVLLMVAFVSLPLVSQNTPSAAKANPIDTIDVICYDLELNTDFLTVFGMAYIFANNEDYKLTGAIFADAVPPGTYTDCVMDLKHIATQKMIAAKKVTLTLSVDQNKHCAIKGTMLGKDNILYNLDLSWTVPTPTKTVNISFETCAQVAYYPDVSNDFTLSNQNDEYDIALDIIGVPMNSSFTEKNLFVNYCVIANKATQDTVKIAGAEGRVWQSNDTTYLSASIIGFNAVQYNIDLWYAVPTPTKTVTLNITNATFRNKMANDGYYALVGQTDDKNTEFAISLLANTVEDIPGTYINDGMFGGFSGKNYDFIHFIGGEYTTYIATGWNEQKQDFDQIISIEQGKAIVSMDENEEIKLVGSFIGMDGVKYNVTLTTQVDKPRFDYDMPSGELESTIHATKEDIYIEDNTAEDGSIFLEVMTDKELLALFFYAEEADAQTIIPEGTYYIDYSSDYETVSASDGSLTRHSSFYATHDGVDFTSMYFFVSGTIEVKNNDGQLMLDINALNSYDVPSHIVLECVDTESDMENITTAPIDCQKIMRDGHVLIIRNGHTYDLMGTIIK